jgi:hypothetical protein
MAKLFWQGYHKDVICGKDADSQRAAYMKGPVVLNLLRQEMGDKPFSNVLGRFAAEHKGGHATISDFVAMCNKATGKDWTRFFDQWCFTDGVPDYRLDGFASDKDGDSWCTEVTIRNEGGATITCPVELQMAEGSLRDAFRVEPGGAETFAFATPREVVGVRIDPDHNTFQGSGEQRRLKMLGVRSTNSEWIWYWRGVVRGEMGDYDGCIEEISRAMEVHGHPAYSFSRGIARWKKGDLEAARSDLVDFIDWVVANPEGTRSLVYPGLVSPSRGEPWGQLAEILLALTGRESATHEELRAWWQANRSTFQPAGSAERLGPGGCPRD